MMMGRSLFVYYKVPAQDHVPVTACVTSYAQQVAQHLPHVSLELMQRPASSKDGLETWMEIFRSPQGITESDMAQIAALAQALQLPHPRMSEIFIPLQT